MKATVHDSHVWLSWE